MLARVRDRRGQLEGERQAKLADLAALDAESPTRAGDPSLLDELPVLDVDLIDAPDEHLRMLFEAFRLQVRNDKLDHHAAVRVTIANEGLDHLDTTVVPLFSDRASRTERRPRRRNTVSLAVGALGREATVRETARPADLRRVLTIETSFFSRIATY